MLGQWFCGKLQVINGSNHHTWSLGGQKGEKKWLNDKLNCESNHLGLYKTISHGPEPNREPDYYQKRTIIGAREPKLNNGENKCDCTRKIQCNGVSFTSALLPVAPKSRFLSRIRSEFFIRGQFKFLIEIDLRLMRQKSTKNYPKKYILFDFSPKRILFWPLIDFWSKKDNFLSKT